MACVVAGESATSFRREQSGLPAGPRRALRGRRRRDRLSPSNRVCRSPRGPLHLWRYISPESGGRRRRCLSVNGELSQRAIGLVLELDCVELKSLRWLVPQARSFVVERVRPARNVPWRRSDLERQKNEKEGALRQTICTRSTGLWNRSVALRGGVVFCHRATLLGRRRR